MGSMPLLSKDPRVRLEAAKAIFKSRDVSAINTLETAIADETVTVVREALLQARAAAVLNSDRDKSEKLPALKIMEDRDDQDALAVVNLVAQTASGKLKAAAAATAKRIRQKLELWATAQNLWYGLSLDSVLLLAAIDLAITFGVMGVINMAHGEMVMLGAYTTFVVQEMIRTFAPGLFDYSLMLAIPAAFLVAGSIGIVIERGIIRYY